MNHATVRLCIFSFLSVLTFCSFLYLFGFYHEVNFLLTNKVYFSLKDGLLGYELHFILFLAVSLLSVSLSSVYLMIGEHSKILRTTYGGEIKNE